MSIRVPSTAKLTLWMAYDQLNWFRIHLLAFIIVPFIFSGFMAAANPSHASGKQVTRYIDALFMCFSAMTGTGLETVDVSGMRPVQQAFLVFLMIVGDMSVVSVITISCRRLWFMKHFSCSKLCSRLQHAGTKPSDIEAAGSRELQGSLSPRSREVIKLEDVRHSPTRMSQTGNSHPSAPTHSARRPSSGGPYRRPSSETTVDRDPPRKGDTLARHHKHRSGKGNTLYPGPLGFEERENLRRRAGVRRDITPRNRKESLSLEPTYSVIPHASSGRAAHSGRGGFPGLAAIIAHLFRVILPSSYTHRVYNYVYDQHAPGFRWAHPIESVEQAISGPLKNYRDAAEAKEAEKVRWLPPGVRGVVVGRNSQIYDEELDNEDLEMFAAIEYRALKVLTYVVVVHQLLYTMVPFAILSIYFSEIHTWDSIFRANGPKQVATVSKVWFSMFQSIAAYTSCGMSLVDASMLPFQTCYLIIYVLVFPILAGNQAMPSFLRMELWIISKFVTPGSELDVLVHFLLTHSRSLGGLLGYIIFNIGLSYYQQYSGWQNFSDGLFQSMSIRAAGFAIFQLQNLAPALQSVANLSSGPSTANQFKLLVQLFVDVGNRVFFVFSMFTSNYPVVMAIRSTNVYEERALGLHTLRRVDRLQQPLAPGNVIFSRYIIDHLLPQIAFDLWPIILATGTICVLERTQLLSSDDYGWFTIWNILFEVTSGYATVGASLGNPNSTASFSGDFRKISKLAMILIMLRGRHRGLPSAIDRATMFPVEYLRGVSGDADEDEGPKRARMAAEAAQTV